jgi:hypothetical protein
MDKQGLNAKLNELNKMLENTVNEANARIAFLNGQIVMVKEFLEEDPSLESESEADNE